MAALNAPAPIDLRVNLLKADRETARSRARRRRGDQPSRRRGRRSGCGSPSGRRCPVSPRSRTASSTCRTRARSSPRCWPARGPACGSSISAPEPAARPWHWRPGWPIAASSSPATSRPAGSNAPARGCAAPGSAMSSAGRCRASATNGSSATPAASTACLSTCPASAPGPGGATPTPNGARSPEDLAELAERQQQILRSAARLVQPGGRLVYATCSLLREEDEAQAEAFLAAAPDFALFPAARAWARDDRRRLPRRRGLSVPDPGAPRHRRLFRRAVRAPPRRSNPEISEDQR